MDPAARRQPATEGISGREQVEAKAQNVAALRTNIAEATSEALRNA
jgi:hypothetical protein